jgi:hypothetical protein
MVGIWNSKIGWPGWNAMDLNWKISIQRIGEVDLALYLLHVLFSQYKLNMCG